MYSHDEASMRKIFTDDHRGQITAAGCLVRRMNPKTKLWEYYVVEELTKPTDPQWSATLDAEGRAIPTKNFSDPGGKAEYNDTSPFVTAKREFTEETRLTAPRHTPTGSIYVAESKYLCYVWGVDYDETSYGSGVWVDTETLKRKRISIRLRHILDMIEELDLGVK
jgi:ADP-ribose pyrophosphatase YjhB (NUDIX family)